MRVAIVHDKLFQLGGAERVALALQRTWPGADLYTSAYDPELVAEAGFERIRATVLQRAPRLRTLHHYFLPFYDRAFRGLRLEGYDVVISSAAMFAKSVRPPAGIPHVCYCYTPIRFLWDLRDELVAELPNRAPVRLAVSAMSPWLRRVDRRAAARVDRFVAISHPVAERIARYYGRESEVIYPPVEIDRYAVDFPCGDYLLTLARLYPYKRVDLAIEAANRLGFPLRVVGDGPDLPRLEGLAGPTVEFVGWVDDDRMPELLGAARGLIAPQVEDFGIAMVEAMAAGTPVIALGAGGATDIVEEGLTGELFAAQTADALVEALERFDEGAYDRATLRERAARFAAPRFAEAMRECVERVVAQDRRSAAR